MDFEWDENKRISNLAKHKLDFVDVVLLFDGPHLLAPGRTVGGEARQLAMGWVRSSAVAVVFVVRDEVTRVVSMRKARQDERKRLQALLG